MKAMGDPMKALAIIPARGGSKRIPRKNIRPFLGQPIIAYVIKAALQSQLFDQVMVSTDDSQIASIAASYGASVPFLRSDATASDHATTADVLLEVLAKYAEQGNHFDCFCCIYPTAPLLTSNTLTKGLDLLTSKQADTVISVVPFSYPIQRAIRIDNDRLSFIQPQHISARTQDLTPSYHDAGQFYWARVDGFMKHKSLFMANTCPIVLSELQVQDIDNEDDWRLAEMKYKLIRQHEVKHQQGEIQ